MEKKEIQYDDARSRIRNGDVLLYKGQGIISRLIRWITRSDYSHAGLAVWWNERLMVMEAVGKGVVVTPLSSNIGHYNGDVDWFWCTKEISEEDRTRLVQRAQEELGKRFARCGMLLVGLCLALKQPLDKDDTFYTSRRFFCSFYVAAAYNSIGLDLRKDRSDGFTTPDDIARSPLLKLKGALKRMPAAA